jgi:nucleotide-binding universal stress UspA family protein
MAVAGIPKVTFSRVIAVVTGDESDEGTVAQAAELVRASRGRLFILYVICMDRSLPVDAEVGDEVRQGEEILRGCEEITRLPRGDVEAELLQAREIGPAVVHEAAVRDADCVVIGTPYPTSFGRFSLGRDIPYILEHAPCHVVLWREPIRGARSGTRPRSVRDTARVG